jgi:hypothetical protein
VYFKVRMIGNLDKLVNAKMTSTFGTKRVYITEKEQWQTIPQPTILCTLTTDPTMHVPLVVFVGLISIAIFGFRPLLAP